jgi:hypothetical protein
MTEIVINSCYGGFGLSDTAILEMRKLAGHWGITPSLSVEARWENYFPSRDVSRDSPILIAAVKAIGGKKASGPGASLKIVTIPDDVKWQIEDYDGLEWVAEAHRIWG